MMGDSTQLSEQVPRVVKPPAQPPDSRFAAELQGFGPVGIFAILLILLTGNITLGGVMLPFGGLLTLLWVRLSRTPWKEIGYVQPASWLRAIVVGVAFGALFKILMKAIVLPLFGADPINHAFHYLTGNKAALPGAIWMMFAAGFGEETVYRGFMFERLGKLLGTKLIGSIAIVVLTSLWFAFGHYANQGIVGAGQAMIVGLVFGTIFARTRQIFMLMWAHTAFDLTALTMIYWNLESRVAHLVFR